VKPALSLTALSLAVLLTSPGPARAAGGWTWPLRGEVITPYRNGDDPYAGGQHRGIDIAGRVGAPVVAATDGTIRFAGVAGSNGLTVGIRTVDGRFDTSYLHLSSIEVRRGALVHAGRRIGAVGTSGRRSAPRPHLHFGIRVAGTRHAYRDPLDFLPPAPPAPEPQRPRGAPAPVGAPARPAPAPVPVGSPQGQRAPDPRVRPVPEGEPLGRPAPNPLPAPRELPHAAPRSAPERSPVPVADSLPRAAPMQLPERRRAPGQALGRAPRPHPEPVRMGRPFEGRASAEPREAGPAARGPDLGLALGCLGLLAAAALLGGTEDGRRTAARGRERIAALLRPLAGRG